MAHVGSSGAHKCRSASVCDGGDPMRLQVKVEMPELIAGSMSSDHRTVSRRWTRQRGKSGGNVVGSGNARWLDRTQTRG